MISMKHPRNGTLSALTFAKLFLLKTEDLVFNHAETTLKCLKLQMTDYSFLKILMSLNCLISAWNLNKPLDLWTPLDIRNLLISILHSSKLKSLTLNYWLVLPNAILLTTSAKRDALTMLPTISKALLVSSIMMKLSILMKLNTLLIKKLWISRMIFWNNALLNAKEIKTALMAATTYSEIP